VILNIWGVKEAAKLEVVLVLGLFAIMLFLVLGGFGRLSWSSFTPLLPKGINKVLITSGFVFISFGGLLNIASISGEVKDPVRNIPRGMILSVLVVTIVYAAILIVVVGVLPADQLMGSLTPIADTGRILLGNTGYILISIAALFAFITTANAGIISASRYPLALSEDNLLPESISRLTKRKRSPVIAISLTGIFIFFCLMLNLTDLVKLGSVVILTLYILTNLAVIVLREGKVQNYKPVFKVPLYPWVNITGIILFAFLIIDMGLVAVEISLGLLVLAFLIYFFYGRKRHRISFAFLHVIERVINRKITDNTLEEELKTVIMSRDEISIDRFHELVENSTVLDFKDTSGLDVFLDFMSGKVADEIGLEKKVIIELFNEREKEGSTAITPFVAIPHIIIPGSNRFKLVIVRAAKGVRFSEENNMIKAVFVLFGTKDERAFHLKALSAIAHIVQNRNFEKMWLAAKNKDQLKDIVLLSERKRFEI
jgi:mannitol/fructose-specific phosphotransferase system IIA component (Ntr-type)